MIIGDAGVGKTNLTNRYVDDMFNEDSTPTIGADFKQKNMEIEGKNVTIKFWDTAGQERYRSLGQKFYNQAHGIVLVYDVTDQSTFDSLTNWVTSLKQNIQKEDYVTILIGNKTDLGGDREVAPEKGKSFAHDHGFFFMETSAKMDLNVKEAFEEVLKKVVHNYFNEEE